MKEREFAVTPSRIALCLFAGIRPCVRFGEITKLKPESVRLDTGMIRIEPEVSKVRMPRNVTIQPIMQLKIAEEVANAVEISDIKRPVMLIWHGGEPLAAGKKMLGRLLDIFEPLRTRNRIRHEIQTNATLLDDAWCEIFKTYNIQVGVSVDDPNWANRDRIDWHSEHVFRR